jgi:HNH endonuclease
VVLECRSRTSILKVGREVTFTMVRACSKAVKQMPWRFLYADEDVWKAFMDEYPGMTWFGTVVYDQKMLGEIHMAWLEDGRFVYVPAWYGQNLGCAGTEWGDAELGSPEAAALVILCCEAGCDPAPALAEEYRLRHFTRPALWRRLASRDGWACRVCGRPIPRRLRDAKFVGSDPLFPEVEHAVPLGAGGPHWWSNLRLAHHSCNLAMGGRDDPHEPDARAMLRAWLREHPKARPCPVDSVDPAHFNGDGSCKCRKVVADGRERDHPFDAGYRDAGRRSLREPAMV